MSRKKFTKTGSWFRLAPGDRAQLKAGCLDCLQSELERAVRGAVAQLVGSLARHELGNRGQGWPELMHLIMTKVRITIISVY